MKYVIYKVSNHNLTTTIEFHTYNASIIISMLV